MSSSQLMTGYALIAAALCFSAGTVHAAVSDNFNRDAIGNSWAASTNVSSVDAGTLLSINDGVLHTNALYISGVSTGYYVYMSNTGTQTSSSYTIQSDIKSSGYSATHWFGIMISYTDSQHYTALRIKMSNNAKTTVQLIYKNGSNTNEATVTSAANIGTLPATLLTDTFYTLSATVTNQTVNWSITNGGTTIASASWTADAAVPLFSGANQKVGYYSMYGSNTPTALAFFDNFSTTASVPEPAAAGIMLSGAAALGLLRKRR